MYIKTEGLPFYPSLTEKAAKGNMPLNDSLYVSPTIHGVILSTFHWDLCTALRAYPPRKAELRTDVLYVLYIPVY